MIKNNSAIRPEKKSKSVNPVDNLLDEKTLFELKSYIDLVNLALEHIAIEVQHTGNTYGNMPCPICNHGVLTYDVTGGRLRMGCTNNGCIQKFEHEEEIRPLQIH